MEENTKEPEDKIQELSRKVAELEQASTKPAIPLPVAIVIAAALIAGSVMYAAVNFKNSVSQSDVAGAIPGTATNAVPANSEDHILGNKDAPVKIVEYSDLECPFCKMFHQTMHQIMAAYGPSGKVAWIYRHFPLDQLHPKARSESRATECAWEQGGNDAFWKFADTIFEITPSNNGLDPAELPRIAGILGLDKTRFVNCLAGSKYDLRIAQHEKYGIDSGGSGTPYSIIFTPKGNKLVVNGAQPYDDVKKLIDQALAE